MAPGVILIFCGNSPTIPRIHPSLNENYDQYDCNMKIWFNHPELFGYRLKYRNRVMPLVCDKGKSELDP